MTPEHLTQSLRIKANIREGVFGYDYSKPESTKSNDPQSGYTRTIYGPNVQGIYAQGVGHSVNIRGADDMKFFGFA